MNVTLEWMKRIMDPSRSVESPTHEPFMATVDGADVAVCTDGHALVLLAHGYPDGLPHKKEKPAMKIADTIAKLAGASPAETPVALSSLKAWLGAAEWPAPMSCPYCDGGGVCDNCECGYHPCGNCEGGKVMSEPGVRQRFFGSVVFNGNKLACAIEPFSDETVKVTTRGPLDAIGVEGDGWRVFLMPLREALDLEEDGQRWKS